MGEKISLDGWTGFRGDFGKDAKDETYFRHWKGFESNSIVEVGFMLTLFFFVTKLCIMYQQC